MGASHGRSIQYSVEVEPSTSPTESTGVRRCPLYPGELVDSLPGHVLENCWDVFELGIRKSANRPCLGTRRRDAAGNLGAYEWITYSQAKEMALKVGFALRKLELVPLLQYEEEERFKGARLLGLLAKNRMEWIICEQACNAYNIAVCPLYDTLGPGAISFILKQTRMTTVAAAPEGVFTLLDTAKEVENCSLKAIIVFGKIEADLKSKAEEVNVKLFQFDDLIEEGKDYQLLPNEQRAKRGDLNTLCYTSGTTGEPKGVMMTHNNFVSLICSAVRGPLTNPELEVSEEDRSISYLPLAHVYERIFCNVFIILGGSIGFYAGDPLKLLDDIKALRPTLFCSVPRLFYRINDKIIAGLHEKSAMAQFLFSRGLNTKVAQLEQNGNPAHSFWDRLVFNKTRALLGGRVRYMLTGSAPLDGTVSTRMKALFCIPLLEGYGMTESLGASFIADPVDTVTGVMGPFPAIEFKLISVPEMNYLVTDDTPRGELLMRGKSVSPGYFLNAEETQKVFDSDGWLHSGDVAALMPNGGIRIIDRRKNIFKLAQGEYLAPEKIESVYIQAPLVSQVFVFGYSTKNFAVGIVVPDETEAKRWAGSNKMKDKSFPDLCREAAFKQAVDKEMKAIAKSGGLKGFEMVKDFSISSEPFTLENNLLTPTMKLKRHEAKKMYEKHIDELYEKLEAAA